MLRVFSSLILLCAAASSSASLSFVVGQDSDTTLPILSQTTDQGASWTSQTLSINSTRAVLGSGACNDALCVVSGYDYLPDNQPLLMQTQDGGTTWNYAVITGADQNFPITKTTCTDNLCIALGNDEGNPLLIQTMDDGNTWSIVPLDPTLSKAVLFDVSCYADRCVAVGMNQPNASPDQSVPLLIQTNDAGSTWTSQHLHGKSDKGVLTSVACNAAQCIVAGSKTEAYTGRTKPALYQLSTNKNAWTPVAVIGNMHRNVGFYNEVSCGPTLCAATGYNSEKSVHFIAKTDQKGEQWASYNFFEDSANIESSHVKLNCADTQCYILWSSKGTANPASMLMSTFKTAMVALDLPAEAASAALYDINCGDGLCYITGVANDGSPLLLQSVQEGAWTSVNVANSCAKGIYISGASM